MQNLGKIFLLLTLMASSIYAGVLATVSPSVVYEGETATYILTIDEGNIKKPQIYDICGNDIISTSSQTSIQMINSDYKRIYTLSYNFIPRKSCSVAGVEVEVDGNTMMSNMVEVVVKPQTQDANADFLLSLEASKGDLFVGEPFELTLLLKQRETAQVVDSNFVAPDFKGFWIKGEPRQSREHEGEYMVTRVVYTLSAQRAGELSITPAEIKIASRVSVSQSWGSFRPQVKWRSYYSNTLDIKAKPLPNGANIIGDFSLDVEVSKHEINPNEALNVTVKVKGLGNLEDIKSFKPYLQNVNIFDEKVSIKGDTLSQKLAFVSDSDFTIPAFSLEYYNTKTQRVEQIKTQEIKIKVKGSEKPNELKIKREDKEVLLKSETPSPIAKAGIDKLWLALVFGLGVLVGVVIMLATRRNTSKKTLKFNIKDEKLLLIKLLPFKDNENVQEIIDVLESNIYSSEKKVVDKKLLKELLLKYNIS